MSWLFLGETTLIFVPALVLLFKRARETPRTLLNMSALACLGGMSYRFIPTSIAYRPEHSAGYFPSVPELFIGVGYVALGIAVFALAIHYFAIRPCGRQKKAPGAPAIPPPIPNVALQGGA